VRNLIKKNPRYSKRINYDALKDLFVDGTMGGVSLGVDDKDDDGLYTIGVDDKGEDEEGEAGMEVVVEEAGSVAGVVRGGVGGEDGNRGWRGWGR
jgi:hypothetical protein